MVLNPTTAAVGHPQASVGCHIWVIWWAQSGLGQALSPLLFHPHGADVIRLYGSDLVSPPLLAALPVGPVLAYNAWVVALLVAGGAGAHALARRAGASAGGGWVAGSFLATAPFLQHELLNGTSELLALALLPWALRALIQVLDAPTTGRAVALGLLSAFAVALSAYNAFFLLILVLGVVVHRAMRDLQPVVTWETLKAGGVATLSGAPILAAVAWLQLGHGASDTYARRRGLLDMDPPLPDSFADGLAWFDPRAAEIPVVMPLPDGTTFEYWTTCTVYVGWAALALIAVAWVRRPQARGGPWPLLAAVGVLLASGPVLRVAGWAVGVGDWTLPMPAGTVIELVPPYLITALHSYRYAAVVVVAVAVLLGRAVQHPAWSLLVVAEALWLGPVPWPAPTTPAGDSPVLSALADAPDGAVLTLPMRPDHLGDLSAGLVAQTWHGKPIQDGGIHSRAGDAATRLYREAPLLAALDKRDPSLPDDAAWGLSQLQGVGFGYVLVSRDATGVEADLQDALGDPWVQDERYTAWRLSVGSAP
jgi:hypothetical protein